ncbi:hypothetical protein QC761_0107950 [Podospora bellae-mahoneyi]|uniref:Secreted protein n=1 Tax=Podospora bellae-mahoneyi TaxID=2093777 RepID=A0ABR0F6U6_9PEZI|nr:hypothetical protein QC761_0107950 [Podospora bellae-mahoneyi]
MAWFWPIAPLYAMTGPAQVPGHPTVMGVQTAVLFVGSGYPICTSSRFVGAMSTPFRRPALIAGGFIRSLDCPLGAEHNS